jgi:small ligand-binding sensory domain FIST
LGIGRKAGSLAGRRDGVPRDPVGDPMVFASALSEEPNAEAAGDAVLASALAGLGGIEPDLAFLFCSDAYAASYDRLASQVREALPGALLVGCSARSVIGAGREIEGRPALSLTLARLPDVTLCPMRVAGDGFPRGSGSWREHFEIAEEPVPHFVLLADPFSCDAEALVRQLDADFPDSTVVGGLASGADRAGGNALFLDERTHGDGLVGVALQGDVCVDAVVAQGCRPIGIPMFVTRARGSLLVEVDGRPPMTIVRELFEAASERDRGLMQTSLFLGVEMRPDRSQYGRGDFLIRNLRGADERTGALAVAAALEEGQVVQFHLRDARTSAEDLDERLARYRTERGPLDRPAGALLFSCLGRGAWLYGVPDHDTDAFRRHIGPVPLGGFFCNGEIGPVERRTFLHGYTSAFGLFRPRAS